MDLKRIFKWKKRPVKSDLDKEFRQLNWDLFSTDEGQRFLYLFKLKMNYDKNAYAMFKDRAMSDMHEGRKDAVRIIEDELQDFAKQQDNENKSN
jgi:hypothetical protein